MKNKYKIEPKFDKSKIEPKFDKSKIEPKFDTYVINLDKDYDRLKKFKKMFYPNKFIRIPAIYGNTSNFENNTDIFLFSRYIVPKNTLACNLSHRLAMKTFLDTSTKDYAVIFEDDVIISKSKDYIKKINEIIISKQDYYDIIKLDFAPFNFKNTTLPTVLLSAYIINKNCAQKILKKNIYYHFDLELSFFNDINIYNNNEILFNQSWDLQNSNNKIYNNNPLSELLAGYGEFKVLRINDTEYSFSDLLLYIIIIYFLIIKYLPNIFKQILIYNIKNAK